VQGTGRNDDERAVAVMTVLDDERRNRIAIRVHNLGHYALLLAVILLAAGAESAVAHPTAALPTGQAAVLAAGPALFLVANTGIRNVFGLRPLLPRLVAAALVAATVPLGTRTAALVQLGAIAVLMAGAFGWEERHRLGRG